jgi:hypothetical protein
MPATLALTLMLAQSVPAAAGDAAMMERIRRQLADSPAIVVSSPSPRDGPVFRVAVHGKPDRPLWADLSGVPPYVRPPFPSYHFEFMQQVTHEEFRAGTLYPVGIPIVTVIEFLTKQIRAGQRKAGEAKAREEVRRALEESLACRANPARPGC